jgi:predicted aspartyl protease
MLLIAIGFLHFQNITLCAYCTRRRAPLNVPDKAAADYILTRAEASRGGSSAFKDAPLTKPFPCFMVNRQFMNLPGGVMGETKVKLTLVNEYDRLSAKAGVIKESQIRKAEVEAVVDTGATPLVIPEALRVKLGLDIEKSGAVMPAGGKRDSCTIAGPVRIHWDNRDTLSDPIVLSGETNEVLLGVYPLEEMDLMVDVVNQCVAGAHGDEWVRYVR